MAKPAPVDGGALHPIGAGPATYYPPPCLLSCPLPSLLPSRWAPGNTQVHVPESHSVPGKEEVSLILPRMDLPPPSYSQRLLELLDPVLLSDQTFWALQNVYPSVVTY